ncbi:Cytochrome P450 [Lachnellula hyalina]|uniref:Cytochrome P450 n=1 Tax=Lachnellula hyalina TaxID=1316788 RepID=A0A8H8QV45_9HELO|nr:Cytochrome P450 [Lachnellula hyalina]TVY23086.1 Cytochrome P450 [Lachnellula hyalina]
MALQIAAMLNMALSYWRLLVPLAITTPLLILILIPLYCHYTEARAARLRRIVLRPLSRILPKPSFISPRLLGTPTWPLKANHETFRALGTDNFLTVSPGGNIFNTADAGVISQILAQGVGFPKAIQIYKSIAIFGQNGTYHASQPHDILASSLNAERTSFFGISWCLLFISSPIHYSLPPVLTPIVVSSDGPTSKYHRRLTGPAFSEKNNRLVWQVALDQTQTMIQTFRGPGGEFQTTQKIVSSILRMSLEVLGRTTLGQVEWTPEVFDDNPSRVSPRVENTTVGFIKNLEFFMANMVSIMITKSSPWWVQYFAPILLSPEKLGAYDLLRQHMVEIIKARKHAIQSGVAGTSTTDLISQLIKGHDDEINGNPQPSRLSDSELIGNLFAFIIAGHETSANSIHFTLVYLAIHPDVQQQVQEEMETVFQGRPTSEWEYGSSFPKLYNGLVGAVLKEVLRLNSPVLTIPKVVSSTAKPLIIEGKSVRLAPGTIIRLCVPSVHRNPKFWPQGPPADYTRPLSPSINDLDEFKPERWLKYQAGKGSSPTRNDPELGTANNQNNSSHFTPIQGSYVPFSDGSRACLGQRFAQVEIMAVLARIFSQYSVELAVDEWAEDEGVLGMTLAEKRVVWHKAHEKAKYTLQNDLTCIITVQLNGTSIPLRFAEKGQERFFDL